MRPYLVLPAYVHRLLPLLALMLWVGCALPAQAAQKLLPAGDGLRSLAYSSNGRLGELVVEKGFGGSGDKLFYRERAAGRAPSAWTQVGSGASQGAALAFDYQDRPRVVYNPGSTEVVEMIRLESGWVQRGRWEIPEKIESLETFANVEQSAIAFDAAGTVHLLLLCHTRREEPWLLYGRLTSGNAVWEMAAPATRNETWMSGFDYPGFQQLDYVRRPRNLGLAIDTGGMVHAILSANQMEIPISGGTMQSSPLYYLNRAASGGWSDPRVILAPAEGQFVDAGIGASIAIAPNGTVAIASVWLPRARTGSPGVAELRYLTRTRLGGWAQQVVATAADGYYSNDGERGTGLEPLLVFDSASRPHIAFTDHASGHFPGTGASSFSGQVRHATTDAGGGWTLSKLISSGGIDPMDFQTFRPAIAVAHGQVAVAATSWKWVEASTSYEATYEVILKGQVSVTAPPAPVIVAQPVSRTVAAGERVTLAATAQAPGISFYQWHKNQAPLPGQNGITLDFFAASGADAGVYQLMVSNKAGVAWSSNATLTVLSPPFFAIPPADQFVEEGKEAVFSAAVTGAEPIRLQWSKQGSALPGETNATLRLPLVSPASAGVYTLTASNALGSASASATLTVVYPLAFRSAALLPSGLLSFTFSAEVHESYALQTSSNLVNWVDVQTIFPSSSPYQFSIRPESGVPRAFYRLRKGMASVPPGPNSLAGRQLLLNFGNGGQERFIFTDTGFTSDIDAAAAGVYTFANGTELYLDYQAPALYANDFYRITLQPSSPTSGAWSGVLHYNNTDHLGSGSYQIQP